MILIETNPLEAISQYQKGTSQPFYQWFWALFLLVIFEVLILMASTPMVNTYNGISIWFRYAYSYLPGGTLALSIPAMAFLFFMLYHEWVGAKTPRERMQDLKAKRAFEAKKKKVKDESLRAKMVFKAKEKKPFARQFNPYYLGWMFLEGLLFGSAIFLILPAITYLFTEILTGQVTMADPLDRNPVLYAMHSNYLQDLALAFGAGVYDEGIWRLIIPAGLAIILPRLPKRFQLGGWPLMLLISFIYALSHYLPAYGDHFSFYTLFYRFCFSLVMFQLIKARNFGVAALSHTVHDFWYFTLT